MEKSTLAIATIVSILFIAGFPALSTATNVGGIIDTDTTWDLAGSPYNMTSEIQIAEGVTLTIEPGVIVNGGSRRIEVWGTINAMGTEEHRITFNGVRIVDEGGTNFVVNISFADINLGSPYEAGTGSGTLTLLDSRDYQFAPNFEKVHE